MIHKYKNLILILITLIAAFLRFNQLNSLPALNADEAAIGYNAYSLIQTGKDEHGKAWPIHFQSFGDWKPGLFFYIVLPFVASLGLNEWAVRIPGALLGVGTVGLIWFLVRELSPKTRWLPEASALFLAISPWHIHFSRGGWEVNVATFFITFGVWSFLRWVNTKDKKWLFVSVLVLVASLYTYHSARIIVPLIALGVVFLYRSQILKNLRMVILGMLAGIVLLFPLARDLLGPAGAARAAGVSIFADPGIIERINEQRGEHMDSSSVSAVFLHNKAVNYTYEFLSNLGEHFGGEFLFFGGDEIQRNKVPEFGQLYLVQLPLLLFGLFSIARNSSGWGIILWWLVIAPMAAALTFQSPHALRAHNMVIPLTIISAYGAVKFLEWLKSTHLGADTFPPGWWNYIGTWGIALLLMLLILDSSRYLHQYYVHMAKEYPFSSQYGVKELVSYIKDNFEKYPEFIVTDRYDQPYILFLFYMKYPPQKFQSEHSLTSRDRFGFSTVTEFDKFRFRKISPEVLEKNKGSLIAGTGAEIEDAANIIRTINFPNGDPAFEILAN